MKTKSDTTVAVVGLGYVGLPLALLADEKGYTVDGYDLDKEKVAMINEGKSPIVESFIDRRIKSTSMKAYSTLTKLKEADIILVCVPTPVKGYEPDLTPLKGAVKETAKHLKKGALLIIESTINPGVCDEVVIPLVEEAAEYMVSKDFYIAHCPERINPGDPKWNVSNINRVVGSNSAKGLELAVEFYESIIDAAIKPMGSIKEAEAVKVVENSFRDVNIAFVNELAKSFQKLGINVENVIDGAATKPFSFMAHRPGVGVGGHCIPVDPYYLIEYAKGHGFDHEFLSLARRINNGMPEFTVETLQDALNEIDKPLKGTEVALLGLSYKPNLDDDRESPSYVVLELLKQHGAEVTTYDPYLPKKSTVNSLDKALDAAEAIFVATAHDEFKSIDGEKLFKHKVQVVFDGRNIYRDKLKGFKKNKVVYRGVGI